MTAERISALVVEDGTCPAGANCYASLAEADTYLVPRGLWPATPPGEEGAVLAARKTASLLRAADYLTGLDWRGTPLDRDQTLPWPRLGVIHTDNQPAREPGGGYLPRAVVVASMVLAAEVFSGWNPQARQARGGRLVSESRSHTEGSIDAIGGDAQSCSRTYAPNAPAEDYLPALRPLRPYLTRMPGGGGGLRLCHLGRA